MQVKYKPHKSIARYGIIAGELSALFSFFLPTTPFHIIMMTLSESDITELPYHCMPGKDELLLNQQQKGSAFCVSTHNLLKLRFHNNGKVKRLVLRTFYLVIKKVKCD